MELAELAAWRQLLPPPTVEGGVDEDMEEGGLEYGDIQNAEQLSHDGVQCFEELVAFNLELDGRFVLAELID